MGERSHCSSAYHASKFTYKLAARPRPEPRLSLRPERAAPCSLSDLPAAQAVTKMRADLHSFPANLQVTCSLLHTSSSHDPAHLPSGTQGPVLSDSLPGPGNEVAVLLVSISEPDSGEGHCAHRRDTGRCHCFTQQGNQRQRPLSARDTDTPHGADPDKSQGRQQLHRLWRESARLTQRGLMPKVSATPWGPGARGSFCAMDLHAQGDCHLGTKSLAVSLKAKSKQGARLCLK